MLNKKVLAAAIVGSLFAGNAFAVQLGTSAQGGTAAAHFAREIVINPTTGTALGTATPVPLTWQVGYSFSTNEVRYARLECSDNIRLAGTVTGTTDPAAVQFGAVNGGGTNVLTFSVTSTGLGTQPAAPDTTTNIASTDVFSITAAQRVTSNSDVSCTVALYDQPSQAQTGGTEGRLAASVRSGEFIKFVESYNLTTTPGVAYASVEADPAFSDFRVEGSTTADTAEVGLVSYGVVTGAAVGGQTAAFKADGTAITLTDLLGTAAPNISRIVVDGDFSVAANANGSFTGAAALGRVQLDGASAVALSATQATFAINAGGVNNGAFTIERRDGTLIPAATYSATLAAAPAATPAVYNVTNKGPRIVGEILRDGTELQAPFVQVPAGWIARIALTNTGSVDRPYSISVLSANADGTDTVETFDLADDVKSGTILAGGTKVIRLNDASLAAAARRGTVIVNVAGPAGQINGLYQVVNPNTGLVTNHVLARPAGK